MLSLLSVITYLDRVCIAVAGPRRWCRHRGGGGVLDCRRTRSADRTRRCYAQRVHYCDGDYRGRCPLPRRGFDSTRTARHVVWWSERAATGASPPLTQKLTSPERVLPVRVSRGSTSGTYKGCASALELPLRGLVGLSPTRLWVKVHICSTVNESCRLVMDRTQTDWNSLGRQRVEHRLLDALVCEFVLSLHLSWRRCAVCRSPRQRSLSV
jgi:hypothetical protein